MADGADQPDVVALLYRADWTRLSLSASVRGRVDDALRFTMIQAGAVSSLPWGKPPVPPPPPELGVSEFRATLRVAGGRFRLDSGAGTGELDGRRSQVGKLLMPRDMLSGWELEVAGPVTVLGRPALRVVATPRPGVRHYAWNNRLERIEVTADAATGILLRREEFYEGQALEMTELTEAAFGDPDADFGTSEVPPAAETGREERGTSGGSSAESDWKPTYVPDWQVKAAKGAANLLGTALTSGFRHSLRRHSGIVWEVATEDLDPGAAMPPVEELADSAASGQPVSDEVLHALYRSGAATFTATMHDWHDAAAWGERLRATASAHGLGGLGSLPGELGGQMGITHGVTRVAIGSAGRYRLDFLGFRAKRSPTAVICDGSRLWRQYQDRVTVSPAVALGGESNAPHELTELIDTSGLLDDDISVVAETQFNGRRVIVLRVHHPRPEEYPADVPIDAELGILLRQVSYIDRKLMGRVELRDVTPLAPSDEDELFGFTAPAGVRVVETSGGPLGEIDMPEAVRLAMRSAGSAAKAARGFLDSLRGTDRG